MKYYEKNLACETYRGPVPKVSIVVLTFNEADNIRECLQSCHWSNDVHVLDSGSTDGTIEIAREMGAQVHHNKFEGFGKQRNWAIDNIPCKHDWHFHLDADERFTDEIVREMYHSIGDQGTRKHCAAFMVPNRMILLGRWLRFSAQYPSYQVRLFHKERCRFVDFGHGQREQADGEVAIMDNPYVHYAFTKGLADWFYKHNKYASREAEEALELRKHGRPTLGRVFAASGIERRRLLKNLSFFLWGRAFLRFTYGYFFKLGFLDGRAGFYYTAMIAMYEYWTELKIMERERNWHDANDQLAARLLEEAERAQ